MNKILKISSIHSYFSSAIILALLLLLSSCATKVIGTRRHLDFMGGIVETKNVPEGEAEKDGYFYGLRYYKGQQTQRLGQYGWAVGFQEAQIEGKTATKRQLLVNRSGFLDLIYYLPSGEKRFLLGILHRTFAGPGVEYGMNEKNRWQLVSLIGPQFQKFIGERTIFGVALLRSYEFERRTIVQIPVYIGWKF